MAGSLLILPMTQWTALAADANHLGWVVVVICLLWIVVRYYLNQEYRTLYAAESRRIHLGP
jgi:ATP/ADP translocase